MIAENLIAKMQTVKALLSGARSLVVLTGAGVSAESGVPTFRGTDGLWEEYRPEDLARPEAFSRDPELIWRFYNWRRELVGRCEPNPAHLALAALERQAPEMLLVTQNVDGLHQRAGNRNVLELHGSLWRLQCTVCTYEEENRTDLPPLPACPRCNNLLRPGVVWFGEQLPAGVLSTVLDTVAKADVMLVAGTSSVVQPAASLAHVAKRSGAVTIEVNLEPTHNTGFMDFALHGRAGEILPQLVEGI
ncbi:SIR2 family NAD-dependent protein deacylase [Salidesulfovibrio onnuriiensis]|uniref:SIR2 family NAD-dependent protein deacylase n=1 Tax=Salidesulfovibrio onnuriiensis TaxID=2583823 RepID=UPI00202AD683|nr:NAD-dependent deacylase [Salidesulfovibrio onnuriiensis]